jgi:hypothetical protein
MIWMVKMIENITKLFKYFLMILKKILYFYHIFITFLKQMNIIIISDKLETSIFFQLNEID